MAGVSITLPTYTGGIDEDIITFVRRFNGFLDAINIDVRDNAQRVRAIGLFRSALSGPAGIWYDKNILGKNWMLNNIYDNTGQNTTANLQARTMGEMNGTNNFRLQSSGFVFTNHPGNNAITVGAIEARMVPPKGFFEDWTNSGGVPTNEAPRFNGANGAVPIILPGIQLGQAIYYFENFYPLVLEERRKVQFGTLEQGNDPVRTFYEKVERYAKILNFGDEVVNYQFFRGLSPDNQLEVDRIGAEKAVSEIVKILEKVEKRKSEMNLGLSKRTGDTDYKSQVQSGSHKPNSGFSPEDVDKMIKSATEKIAQNFQVQIQELQAKIPTVPYQKNNDLQIAREFAKNITDEILNKFATSSDESIKDYPVIPDFNRNESGQSIFQQVGSSLRKQDQYIKPSSDTEKMVSRIVERIEQQRLDKEIEGLISKINNFRFNDPDAMDTSNLIREIATDDDEYTLQLVRKKK